MDPEPKKMPIESHSGDCSIYNAHVRLCDCGYGRLRMSGESEDGLAHFGRLKEIEGHERSRLEALAYLKAAASGFAVDTHLRAAIKLLDT